MSPLDREWAAYPVTQAQVAYDALRRAITSGELPGGAHIVQSEWADRIDVSITPIREAIRRLEQDGLARSRAHKGTTVTTLSLEGAQEIYQLRTLVDPQQFACSGCPSPDAIERARELCVEMNVVTDPVEFCDLDHRFHGLIMGLDDSWTSRVVGQLLMAARPYITIALNAEPDLMVTANEEHFQMLDVAEAGDVESLVQLNARHLTLTLEVLEKVTFPISASTSAPQ